jgi:exosortase D (VPLPA-CTERM-specific)
MLVCAFLIFIHYEGLDVMVYMWDKREEYGHGYIIPLITLFLIWQKKNQLEAVEFKGSWLGVLVVLFGVLMFFAGELGSMYTIIQYAFLVSLYGIVLSLLGKEAFRIILVPLIILVFMIPLPQFLFNNISFQLQLISSELGVAFIRMFDISVYLEGNVIDLGTYKLQVVEACNGLRYLFPLMTLGFIAAYLFSGELWKKAVIFLSAIPITILMNSIRIGLIGVTVEYWGQEMAEGFLHDFEGWVIFMSCMGILIAEMWVLSRIGKNKMSLQAAFGLDFPEPAPKDAERKYRRLNTPFIVSLLILLVVASASSALPEREEIIPGRKSFSEFPMTFDDWKGKRDVIERVYLDVLKLTDYVMADYYSPDGKIVNFYSAYYETQKKGEHTHSPRSCIPGGGWTITSMTREKIPDVDIEGAALYVNRLLITKGETRQLVYYWFQQRGRIITNEYLMKWYFLLDSIAMNRTDGALIRLTTLVPPGKSMEDAEALLISFVKKTAPVIPEYVPN